MDGVRGKSRFLFRENSLRLTVRVALVFQGRWLRPPLEGEVSHFGRALFQQHVASSEQDPLQLENGTRELQIV